MSEDDGKFLDAFAFWLASLGDDAVHLADVLSAPETPEPAKRALVGGLNYLFKSLDLIPDGIDDIGFLDDAFVLRMAAQQAVQAGTAGPQRFTRLAQEAGLVADFLGDVAPRLERYVTGLRTGAARGRTVEEIMGDGRVLEQFRDDVTNFARSYQSPAFSKDPKNLVKLRAFFDAKLPR